MSDNERGFHHPHKVDKGIQHIDHPQRSHNDLPPPLRGDAPMNADPHARGPRMDPYMPESARPPRGEPTAIAKPYDPAPHPYTPAAQKQKPNTYGKVPHR